MAGLAETMLGWSGRPDPTMIDEITGQPVRRDVFGNIVQYGPLNPPATAAAEPQLEATRGRGSRGTSPPVNRLGDLASAVAAGATQGITAPRRALDGEPVTLGDVWATALDWGVMSPLGSAPKGALRSGASMNQPELPLGTAQEAEILSRLQQLSAMSTGNPGADQIAMYLNTGQLDRITPQMFADAESSGTLGGVLAAFPDHNMNLVGPHPVNLMDDVYHHTSANQPFSFFERQRHGTSQLHDRVGVHVGTQEAAEQRGRSLPFDQGFLMKLKARTDQPFDHDAAVQWITDRLGSYDEYYGSVPPGAGFDPDYHLPKFERYATLRRGEPWSEEHFNQFVYDASQASLPRGSGWSDYNTKFPLQLGNELAEAGYTNVPYINGVEDAGSVSNIMLTDGRQFGDLPVLRYENARFDPRFYHLPNLTAGLAGAGLSLGALMAEPQQPRSDKKE